jgi:peptidoglycan/xylan/chitin deacetylase (PgdA/CDA1 family)
MHYEARKPHSIADEVQLDRMSASRKQPRLNRINYPKNLLSIFLMLAAILALSACRSDAPVEAGDLKESMTPSDTLIRTTDTPTSTAIPSTTKTATPEPSSTPTISPTPEWVRQGPGALEAPILLYHRVRPDEAPSRYTISPDIFSDQMAYLADAGCQTIQPSQLREAMLNGLELPPHPIIITFDDGNEDNYTHAFPIMQEYGFSGTAYMVANRLGAEGYLSIPQLQEMIAAGWEIGSHSMTHADLTQVERSQWRIEVLDSRLKLERDLEVEVTSFAFPFGSFVPDLARVIENFGYRTGMGLGKGFVHDLRTIYYLQRVEILGSMDLEDFKTLVGGCGGS